MNVHFASLVCVDFDLDLIPHWIKHYNSFGLDSYKVWLHSPSDNKRNLLLACTAFLNAGWAIEEVDSNRTFAVGALRRELLWPYSCSLPKDDFLVIADSDEFQVLKDYRERLKEFPTIRGQLIDRWDKSLHVANLSSDLHDQYPLVGEVWQEVVNVSPEGTAKEFHRVEKNKVCAFPAGSPGDYNGSHVLIPELPGNELRIPVEHFTWRSTIIDRMCGKWYFGPAALWYVMEYFGMDPNKDAPPSFWKRVEEHEAVQAKSKGWIPGDWTQEDYDRAMASDVQVADPNVMHTPRGVVDVGSITTGISQDS